MKSCRTEAPACDFWLAVTGGLLGITGIGCSGWMRAVLGENTAETGEHYDGYVITCAAAEMSVPSHCWSAKGLFFNFWGTEVTGMRSSSGYGTQSVPAMVNKFSQTTGDFKSWSLWELGLKEKEKKKKKGSKRTVVVDQYLSIFGQRRYYIMTSDSACVSDKTPTSAAWTSV